MERRKFFKRPYVWAVIYSFVLLAMAAFVLLDTFVIPYPAATAAQSAALHEEENSDGGSSSGGSVISVEDYYEDDNITISIETQYVYNTMVYIADIVVSDASYLKTAFADGTYGRNIKQVTSEIADANDAVFAVNGDYYGFRNYGYVMRNGVLYRDTPGDTEDLVIDGSGDFSIVSEDETDAQSLVDSGVWQVLSFGPALINGGEIAVDESTEVSKAMQSNPRTAIGQAGELHYIVIVADGRTSESEGLTLLELAQLFEDQGCTVAYNLDGGGSSTMWLDGNIINNPTDGRSFGERSVSDIVYFG